MLGRIKVYIVQKCTTKPVVKICSPIKQSVQICMYSQIKSISIQICTLNQAVYTLTFFPSFRYIQKKAADSKAVIKPHSLHLHLAFGKSKCI